MPRRVEVVYWPYACHLSQQKVVACCARVGLKNAIVCPVWFGSPPPWGARADEGRLHGKKQPFPDCSPITEQRRAPFGPFDGLVVRPIKFLSRVRRWRSFSPSLSSAVGSQIASGASTAQVVFSGGGIISTLRSPYPRKMEPRSCGPGTSPEDKRGSLKVVDLGKGPEVTRGNLGVVGLGK